MLLSMQLRRAYRLLVPPAFMPQRNPLSSKLSIQSRFPNTFEENGFSHAARYVDRRFSRQLPAAELNVRRSHRRQDRSRDNRSNVTVFLRKYGVQISARISTLWRP